MSLYEEYKKSCKKKKIIGFKIYQVLGTDQDLLWAQTVPMQLTLGAIEVKAGYDILTEVVYEDDPQ